MEVALLQEILARLGKIEDSLGISGGASSGSSGAGDAAEAPAAIRAFDAYCASHLQPFVAACNKLGGGAEEAGKVVQKGWEEMRTFLLIAAHCKEPAQANLPPLLAGVSAQMKAAQSLIKRNEWEKHAKTCAEGLGCLNWLVVKPAPREIVESSVGASDYWANNIRKEFRTTNPDQVAFCDTFKALLLELMA
ncbi:hypothetical protein EON64_09705, partial [archaeon]